MAAVAAVVVDVDVVAAAVVALVAEAAVNVEMAPGQLCFAGAGVEEAGAWLGPLTGRPSVVGVAVGEGGASTVGQAAEEALEGRRVLPLMAALVASSEEDQEAAFVPGPIPREPVVAAASD